MTNISQEVTHLLSSDVAIQSCLCRNLINMRGLAKYIIDKHNVDASIDSVISAIRRFDSHCEFQNHQFKLKELFSGSMIKTSTNLVALDISGRNNIKKCFNLLNSTIDLDKGETLRIVKGNAHLRLVIDEKNLESLKKELGFNNYIEINNLVELTVEIKDSKLHITKGVMARISNELSATNINIIDFIFTPSLIHIFVDKKDYVQAHSTLVSITERY